MELSERRQGPKAQALSMQTGEKPVALSSGVVEGAVALERRRAEMLDEYLEGFVLRAAEHLHFHKTFVALAESGSYEIRYVAEHGHARAVRARLPAMLERRAQTVDEPFWTT